MQCHICNAPEAEPHFGGISCRACAAFFRRFFHSKKTIIMCTCKQRVSTSHPCRSCRVQKCYEAGMVREKVQRTRDKHSAKTSTSLSPRIVPRATPNVSWSLEKWADFELNRSALYGASKFTELNIFQASCHVNSDIEMTWRLVESVFPQTAELGASDKYSLLANFVPKWWQLEPVIDHMRNEDYYHEMGQEEFECMVTSFYEGAFLEGRDMSREELLKTFKPIWWFYTTKLVLPIAEHRFDTLELMAIVWLVFFDSAHTNLSELCARMCETIRKVILREVRGYQIDKNHSETRIVDTMATLPIVERAVEKFEEELIMCELNGVAIHADFQAIMRLQRL